jgi:hypothetical protein
MADIILRSLERDRKKAVRTYGEEKVLACLSEKTDYQVLCDIYAKLQIDIMANKNNDEAKWLKSVIEKTIFEKVMAEHGYSPSGRKLESC